MIKATRIKGGDAMALPDSALETERAILLILEPSSADNE